MEAVGEGRAACEIDSIVEPASEKTSHRHAEPDVCTICLASISERAVATPCNHLSFDFLCLVQWVQTSARCPLCTAAIREIQYDWRSPNDYKRYIVPAALPRPDHTRSDQERARRATEPVCQSLLQPALARRRHVYEHNLYAAHVGSNQDSDYTEYSTARFASSPELQSRAKMFLRRELAVLDSMLRTDRGRSHTRLRPRTQQASASYLVEYVVAVLRTHDPRAYDGHAQELLMDFLPAHTAHLLLHELVSWLRSPFARLQDWDEVVQYAATPSAQEVPPVATTRTARRAI